MGGQLAATPAVGEVDGTVPGEAARRPAIRGNGPESGEPEQPRKDKGKGEDKGDGKGKGKGDNEKKGKAKGHGKPKHHGKAKGHSKWQGRSVIAFAPRGTKPSHVSPSRAGKYSGWSAHSHARARR